MATEKADSTRYTLRQEDVELSAIDAQIDDAFQELDATECLATVAQHELPPAIWAELSFAFGRHKAMSETVAAIRGRLEVGEQVPAYRLVLQSLGANLSVRSARMAERGFGAPGSPPAGVDGNPGGAQGLQGQEDAPRCESSSWDFRNIDYLNDNTNWQVLTS